MVSGKDPGVELVKQEGDSTGVYRRGWQGHLLAAALPFHDGTRAMAFASHFFSESLLVKMRMTTRMASAPAPPMLFQVHPWDENFG